MAERPGTPPGTQQDPRLAAQLRAAGEAYQRGDYRLAVSRCDAIMRTVGARSDLLNLRAMALLELGEPELAADALEKAIGIEPGRVEMRINAGRIYERMHDHRKALKQVREVVRLSPNDPQLLVQAARIFRAAGDRKTALRCLDRALGLAPQLSVAWHTRGGIHLDLGDREQARSDYERAVTVNPNNIRALAQLAPLASKGQLAANVQTLLQQAAVSQAPLSERASAVFALADIERRAGRHGPAFEGFRQANELAAQAHPANRESWRADQQARVAAAQDFLPTDAPATQDSGMVFVIGMPRSGTSLVEQVLSAHPDVQGCGETQGMLYVEDYLVRFGVGNLRQLREMKDKDRKATLDRYLAALPSDASSYPWVVDKSPLNFMRVDIIDALLPNARFIHCTRHPLDTILSCWFQDFQREMTWTLNLEDIAYQYIAQVRIMEAWCKAMPERILEVNYEAMVSDLPSMARKMSDFLGLEYQPEMEAPHKVERAVFTASNLQVREPVYTTSVGRWKSYLEQLQPVIQLLQSEGIEVPLTG